MTDPSVVCVCPGDGQADTKLAAGWLCGRSLPHLLLAAAVIWPGHRPEIFAWEKTTMTVDISEFTMEAYDEVMVFWQQTEGVGFGEADLRENIRRHLRHNPGMSFVARDKARLVGTALSSHDGRRGYLHHVAVHPDYRRKGLGRELVNQCLQGLATVGIPRCYLHLLIGNDEGKRFWERIGWRERGVVTVMEAIVEPPGAGSEP